MASSLFVCCCNFNNTLVRCDAMYLYLNFDRNVFTVNTSNSGNNQSTDDKDTKLNRNDGVNSGAWKPITKRQISIKTKQSGGGGIQNNRRFAIWWIGNRINERVHTASPSLAGNNSIQWYGFGWFPLLNLFPKWLRQKMRSLHVLKRCLLSCVLPRQNEK